MESLHPPVSPSGYRPSPFSPITRLAVWPTFLLALANGAFLFFLPGLAKTDYAWSIQSPVSAAFLGVCYLTAAVPVGLALLVHDWRSVHIFIWPLALFCIGLVVATLIHASLFHWAYPPTWVWTAVYALAPIALAWLWFKQERTAQRQLQRDTRLRPIMVVALVLGGLLTLGSLLLFLTPESFLQIWPWPITPLLGRVFACWYLLMGLSLVLMGTIIHHPHEAVVPSVWLVLVNLLLLLLPLLYPATMRFGTGGFWLWIALELALVVGAGWISIQCLRWMRASGQHL